ncbi:MAG: multicopper oxidase family protein [Nanoarchaeota archaeon]|nr:multicopper oxidase family protein [Nanoarchaeota archaeon]
MAKKHSKNNTFMIIGVIIIVLLISFLIQKQKETNLQENSVGMMEGAPCHQMGDGSWMGDCDEDSMQENSMGMMMGSDDGTYDLNEKYDIEKIPYSKNPSIIELNEKDTFSLSADIVKHKINGIDYIMYGYNQQIPGPIIKVAKGTTINVEFKNNIDQETTIHWHGLRHDNKNDGVPGVNQEPVKPGEDFTYSVYFPDAGVYWYHPHIREDSQQDLGLAGNMLVSTVNGEIPANKEELLILDDALIEDGKFVPYGKEHANFALMGRFGNTMLINGKTDYSLKVNKGDVVRFYLTNVANARPFNFRIDGAKMKLVGGDIGFYEREVFIDNIIIAPAERYIIDVYFEKEGEYSIQNNNPHADYNLGTITANNKESSSDFSDSFNTLKAYEDVEKDIEKFRQYFGKPIDYTINLNMMMDMAHNTGMMMDDEDDIEWEDNMPMMNRQMTTEDVKWIIQDQKTGKENMDFVMNAKIGDVLKIRIVNNPNSMHPMQHPIHLHGQRFLVLNNNGVKNENLVWKDTVLVSKGDTVEILVDVTNPGEWMLHCHIAEHLEAGMMTSLIVSG